VWLRGKAVDSDNMADAERLDWLEKNSGNFNSMEGPESFPSGEWVVYLEFPGEEDTFPCAGSTIRDAIDAAMEKLKMPS
jgi:hypothetical protein